MIRCVIIDDDDFAINSLKELINKVKDVQDIEIIKTYLNPKEAIEEIGTISFDLLFVDYEMPGYNGVEIVKKVDSSVSVIFVTSHSELSEDIVNEVNIKGFLSKPAKKEDLEKILKKGGFSSSIKSNLPSRIFIPNGSKELYFNPNEIFYIESDKQYKDIYGTNKTLAKNIKIEFPKLEKILSPYGFEQISRKHMININKIKVKSNKEVELINGKILYISDSKKKGVIDKLRSYFK